MQVHNGYTKNNTQYHHYRMSLLVLCIALNEDPPPLSLSLHVTRPIPLLSLAALCPGESQSQETQIQDLTDTLNSMSGDIMEVIEELRSGRKIKELLELITGNVFGAKQN